MSKQTETRDSFGPYSIVWQCEPPAVGATYRVVDQEWNDDFTVRTIWLWVPA